MYVFADDSSYSNSLSICLAKLEIHTPMKIDKCIAKHFIEAHIPRIIVFDMSHLGISLSDNR